MVQAWELPNNASLLKYELISIFLRRLLGDMKKASILVLLALAVSIRRGLARYRPGPVKCRLHPGHCRRQRVSHP